MKRMLALLLAAVMLLGTVGACAEGADQDLGTPLVVATSQLSQKFSPFYHDTDYDKNVVDMTQALMMTTDRTGGIIYNGIEGETHSYNGTDYTYYGTGDISVNYDEESDITTYTYKMREDLKFSDGEPANIDDVIFTYYVYLDPAYVGSATLSSYDIVGLQAYRTQIPEANLDAVNEIADAVKAAGAGYTVKEGDAFTQAAYDAYWTECEKLWKEDCAGMVEAICEGYAAHYAQDIIGKTAEEVAANDGLKAAFAMALWGFGTTDDEMTTLTSVDGRTFDLANGQYPAIEDYYLAAAAKYEGSFADYLDAGESEMGTTTDAADAALASQAAADLGVDSSAGVPNISGITRVDDYTVEVRTHGYEAPAIYNIMGVEIVPMHYYGDPAQYDYANNMSFSYSMCKPHHTKY